MINGISGISGFSAISYLDNVKGVSKAEPVTPKVENNTPESDSAKPAPAKLQSGNTIQLSSAVLAILQETANASTKTSPLASLVNSSIKSKDITASLFGSEGKGNDITSRLLGGSQDNSNNSILSSSFSNASSASDDVFTAFLKTASTKSNPLQQAVSATLQAQANTKAQSTPMQDILSSNNTATNAYNKVLIQNAQATLNAGISLLTA